MNSERVPISPHCSHCVTCRDDMPDGCGCQVKRQRVQYFVWVVAGLVAIGSFFGGLAAGYLAN